MRKRRIEHRHDESEKLGIHTVTSFSLTTWQYALTEYAAGDRDDVYVSLWIHGEPDEDHNLADHSVVAEEISLTGKPGEVREQLLALRSDIDRALAQL